MQQRWLRVCHTQADSTPLLSLIPSDERSKKLGTLLRNVKERANISSKKFRDAIRYFVSYALLESCQLLLILRNAFQEQMFDFLKLFMTQKMFFSNISQSLLLSETSSLNTITHKWVLKNT